MTSHTAVKLLSYSMSTPMTPRHLLQSLLRKRWLLVTIVLIRGCMNLLDQGTSANV